jgi:hypothetical protein
MLFRCTALLMSLAFAGAPVAADFCAVSCQAAHTHGGAASSAHSGHHHTSTTLFSINQPQQPCGHDHDGLVAVTAASDRAHARSLTTAGVPVLPASLPALPLWTAVSDLHNSNSPPGPSVRGFASPIRI